MRGDRTPGISLGAVALANHGVVLQCAAPRQERPAPLPASRTGYQNIVEAGSSADPAPAAGRGDRGAAKLPWLGASVSARRTTIASFRGSGRFPPTTLEETLTSTSPSAAVRTRMRASGLSMVTGAAT